MLPESNRRIQSKPGFGLQRLDYLDSSRGIAAWMVVIFHLINWKYNEHAFAEWSFLFINGRESVSFFFVLSGLVLSYKYLQLNAPLDLRSFYFTRFMRLFPGYFITVLANFLYAHRDNLGGAALQKLFLNNSDGFWEEALMIRTHSSYFPAGWTMNIELCASLLLPFAIVLFIGNKKLIGWMLFFCVFTGNSIVRMLFVHFLLGMLIAGNFSAIRSERFRSGPFFRYRYLLLAVVPVLYSLRQINRLSPLGPTLLYVLDYLNIDFFFFSGIASAVFLVFLIRSDKLQRILSAKLLRFFGRISYGIYLMHWLVGNIIFTYWDDFWLLYIPNEPLRIAALLLTGIAFTIVLATLLYHLVELPALNWAKRVSARWRKASAPLSSAP